MMKRNLFLSAMLVLSVSWILVAQYSWGTHKGESALVSQTFTVENMTCAACPITVRKAMTRVDGVHSVEVNFEAKTVTATYDPALANTATIAEASTAVGFPAHASGETP
jgi:periplasmic mercuric ion binding protein